MALLQCYPGAPVAAQNQSGPNGDEQACHRKELAEKVCGHRVRKHSFIPMDDVNASTKEDGGRTDNDDIPQPVPQRLLRLCSSGRKSRYNPDHDKRDPAACHNFSVEMYMKAWLSRTKCARCIERLGSSRPEQPRTPCRTWSQLRSSWRSLPKTQINSRFSASIFIAAAWLIKSNRSNTVVIP